MNVSNIKPGGNFSSQFLNNQYCSVSGVSGHEREQHETRRQLLILGPLRNDVTIEIIGFDAGLKISFRMTITTTKRSIAGLERPEHAPWETARRSAVALVQKPHRHRYNHTVDNKEDEKVFQQSHLPEGSRIDEVRLAAQTVKPSFQRVHQEPLAISSSAKNAPKRY